MEYDFSFYCFDIICQRKCILYGKKRELPSDEDVEHTSDLANCPKFQPVHDSLWDIMARWVCTAFGFFRRQEFSWHLPGLQRQERQDQRKERLRALRRILPPFHETTRPGGSSEGQTVGSKPRYAWCPRSNLCSAGFVAESRRQVTSVSLKIDDEIQRTRYDEICRDVTRYDEIWRDSGFPFHSGGLLVAGVFARRCPTVRNRPQPSATVRNRPREGHMAVPLVSSAEGVTFGGFTMWHFFVSRGRRGTSWHSEVFCSVSKVVFCGRRVTFVTFSEDALQFSWQGQHFGRVHRHLAWQAQHFRRVVLRVFCEPHCQGCVRRRQGANSMVGVAFCEMWWKLTEASHETSILR